MKSLNVILKNFRYLTIILSFLISVHLIQMISLEDKIIKNNNNNNKAFIPFLDNNKKLPDITFNNPIHINEKFQLLYMIRNIISFIDIIDILWKCGLAFILGALISEKKFFYIGKI